MRGHPDKRIEISCPCGWRLLSVNEGWVLADLWHYYEQHVRLVHRGVNR